MTDQAQPFRAVAKRLQLEIFVPYPQPLAEKLMVERNAIAAKIAELPVYVRPLIFRYHDNHPDIADFIETLDYTAIRA